MGLASFPMCLFMLLACFLSLVCDFDLGFHVFHGFVNDVSLVCFLVVYGFGFVFIAFSIASPLCSIVCLCFFYCSLCLSIAAPYVFLLFCVWCWLGFHVLVHGSGSFFRVFVYVLGSFFLLLFSLPLHRCPLVFSYFLLFPIGLPIVLVCFHCLVYDVGSVFIVLSTVVACVRCLSLFIVFAVVWVFVHCLCYMQFSNTRETTREVHVWPFSDVSAELSDRKVKRARKNEMSKKKRAKEKVEEKKGERKREKKLHLGR